MDATLTATLPWEQSRFSSPQEPRRAELYFWKSATLRAEKFTLGSFYLACAQPQFKHDILCSGSPLDRALHWGLEQTDVKPRLGWETFFFLYVSKEWVGSLIAHVNVERVGIFEDCGWTLAYYYYSPHCIFPEKNIQMQKTPHGSPLMMEHQKFFFQMRNLCCDPRKAATPQRIGLPGSNQRDQHKLALDQLMLLK